MALTIGYTTSFLRQFKKLDSGLQVETKRRIEEFRDQSNHPRLDVHKLHGKHAGCSSFSIDYRNRIVFEYRSKNNVALLAVGDHDIYR